jgi:hypothetical protein
MQLWWLAIVVVLACERPAPRSPESAYRAFAEAVRHSDARAAWATLSRPTRAMLEARSKAIAAASGGMVKDEPAMMVFQSGTRPAPVGEVKLLQSSESQAVVEVTGAAGPQRVKLVHDGEEWLVDLSDVLGEKQPRE